MYRILSGEALAKVAIILCFVVSYGWICHAMARDEKVLEKAYAKRLETIEKSVGITH